jgi:hypothetical protein
MLDGLVPDLAPRLLIAIGGVAVAFLVLIAVLLFLRRRNSPLFVKGGRAREHRLLVLDAAAVDAKRRLVLIKRDDSEHLIMIGGPTDIVIETGIASGRPRVAAAAQPVQKPAEQPVVVQRPAAAEKPAARPAPVASNIVPIPARPAEAAAGAQRPNAARPEGERGGRPEGERRQGREQNGERGFNQRRLERQAARAAEAAKSAQQPAAAEAIATQAPSQEKREPENTPRPQTSEVRPPAAADAAQKANPVAARAENALDQARDRVLTPPMARNTPVSNEDAIRQLEEQLEAGKAEAARAEAARAKAARAEAARAEAARLEAERAAAARADAERAEAVHAEAARLEAMRLEAQKAEAARLEAERAERMRLEAERAEAERAEAARLEAEKSEAARLEAARIESERIAAARAEAMARFEAARRAQAEQRLAPQQPVAAQQTEAAQQPLEESSAFRQAQWPVAEPPIAAPAAGEQQRWPVMEPPVAEPATAHAEPETAKAAELDENASKSQERLASDFEKLLEAELEADGILDHYGAPSVAGERREPGLGTPAVDPAERNPQPITGAVPGMSIEQDMARRLGEISLNKKSDAG